MFYIFKRFIFYVKLSVLKRCYFFFDYDFYYNWCKGIIKFYKGFKDLVLFFMFKLMMRGRVRFILILMKKLLLEKVGFVCFGFFKKNVIIL